MHRVIEHIDPRTELVLLKAANTRRTAGIESLLLRRLLAACWRLGASPHRAHTQSQREDVAEAEGMVPGKIAHALEKGQLRVRAEERRRIPRLGSYRIPVGRVDRVVRAYARRGDAEDGNRQQIRDLLDRRRVAPAERGTKERLVCISLAVLDVVAEPQ